MLIWIRENKPNFLPFIISLQAWSVASRTFRESGGEEPKTWGQAVQHLGGEGWWEVQVHEHRICLGLYYVIKMILETDPEGNNCENKTQKVSKGGQKLIFYD